MTNQNIINKNNKSHKIGLWRHLKIQIVCLSWDLNEHILLIEKLTSINMSLTITNRSVLWNEDFCWIVFIFVVGSTHCVLYCLLYLNAVLETRQTPVRQVMYVLHIIFSYLINRMRTSMLSIPVQILTISELLIR